MGTATRMILYSTVAQTNAPKVERSTVLRVVGLLVSSPSSSTNYCTVAQGALDTTVLFLMYSYCIQRVL
jgi:fructose-1,6-bisphosphatase/inositol monophosphatase family enzyme